MRPGFLGTMKGRAGRYNALVGACDLRSAGPRCQAGAGRNRRDRVQARPEPAGLQKARAVSLGETGSCTILTTHGFSAKACFVEAINVIWAVPPHFQKYLRS